MRREFSISRWQVNIQLRRLKGDVGNDPSSRKGHACAQRFRDDLMGFMQTWTSRVKREVIAMVQARNGEGLNMESKR